MSHYVVAAPGEIVIRLMAYFFLWEVGGVVDLKMEGKRKNNQVTMVTTFSMRGVKVAEEGRLLSE
jgi:hypothetical protein